MSVFVEQRKVNKMSLEELLQAHFWGKLYCGIGEDYAFFACYLFGDDFDDFNGMSVPFNRLVKLIAIKMKKMFTIEKKAILKSEMGKFKMFKKAKKGVKDMQLSEESLEELLGVKRRARQKNEVESLDYYFKNPIIHRQIHGDKIYVPLNIDRIWNQIS